MVKSKTFTIGASIVGSLALVSGIAYTTLTGDKTEDGQYSYEDQNNAGDVVIPPLSSDDSSAEQQFNENIYEPADLYADSSNKEQPQVWYALSDEESKKKETKSYGSESSGFLQFVLGKVKTDRQQQQQQQQQQQLQQQKDEQKQMSIITDPDTGLTVSGDYKPSLNTPVTGVDTNSITGSNNSNTNKDTNSSTGSSSNNITIDSTTNFKDSTGAVTSNSASNKPFELYDYVAEGTKVLSGNSKSDKIFDELDSLNPMFVVKLNQGENIDDLLSTIVNNYEGQLLVDNLKYGRLASNDALHYKIEVQYHISQYQKTELTKWAKSLVPKTSLTEQEKVKLVNDKVKALASYSEKGANIYSPYVLYKQGKGVCQAYASLTKFALDVMGIDNGIVTGVLDGVPHAWNVVYIGGQELHVDVTNNDVTSSDKYLLVSKEQIGKTHVIEKVIN